MWHVEYDARNRRTQRIKNRFEGIGAKIADPLEGRRRRQQAEVIGTFRQQPIDECVIDAVRRL
jgi:hypothetical protein